MSQGLTECPVCGGGLKVMADRDPGSGTTKALVFCEGECGICATPSGWARLVDQLQKTLDLIPRYDGTLKLRQAAQAVVEAYKFSLSTATCRERLAALEAALATKEGM